MRYTNDQRVEDLKVAYIGGGSRGWAWGFMSDIAMDGQLCGEVSLYDIDHAAAERNKIIGDMISAHPDAVSRWRYTVADSLKTALTGADFVVISILPGTFDEMESDVHAPEKYGVYQSVGDTAGPGGMLRAFRTIPMYVTIAEAIRDYAPKAWVINYTNPMSLCVQTLYHVFPQVRAFGCCHEVFGTQKLLAAMLEKEHGIKDVKRQDIHTGVNHFTWLTSATYQGQDLFPLYREFALKYYDTGFIDGKDENWMNRYFDCKHRVKFDLFLKYGLIAAAGDRHLAEFMPPWYLKDPQTALDWGFTLTPVSWRKQDLTTRLARSEALATGAEKLDLKASGEEGHLLIKALLGLGDIISNVNIPNYGQISNLPLGAVVETNAAFGKDRIAPVYEGDIPQNILALVYPHVIEHQNTLTAALTCDRQLALTTLLSDPLARLSPKDGQALLDEMLENTRAYLPRKWFE